MIEIRDLQKLVDQHLALDLPAFSVQPGETAAIVGPADSGKEELFALLTGRTRPSTGTLRLAGLDPAQQKELFSRRVGVLFLEDGLYLHQSPFGNLNLHCQLHGLPKSRAVQVLSEIGLADQSSVALSKLPPGLQRRLAFGRAILHRPQVLLLQEPFARCDQDSIVLLCSLINQAADQNTAILILADGPAHLPACCDTTYQLHQGRLQETSAGGQESQTPLPFKIPVRLDDKVILINPAEILFAEAEGGRSIVQIGERRLPTQFTLSELEVRLARSGFFRAHRSYLVNLQHVQEIIAYTRNSYSLRLNDPSATQIPLSKAAANELRELLGY